MRNPVNWSRYSFRIHHIGLSGLTIYPLGQHRQPIQQVPASRVLFALPNPNPTPHQSSPSVVAHLCRQLNWARLRLSSHSTDRVSCAHQYPPSCVSRTSGSLSHRCLVIYSLGLEACIDTQPFLSLYLCRVSRYQDIPAVSHRTQHPWCDSREYVIR